jgi:hypothetical protein
MSGGLALLVAALAGAALAALYLALLWAGAQVLGVRQSVGAFAGLAALRAALIVGALWAAFALGAEAAEILAGLAGFVALRVAVIRRAEAGDDRRPRWR